MTYNSTDALLLHIEVRGRDILADMSSHPREQAEGLDDLVLEPWRLLRNW